VLQSLKRNPKQRRKHKYYIIRIGVTHMREKELSEEHSPSVVKQALAIASKMGGNMTGATAAIEKLSPGLSKHPQVAAVLKRANEEVKEGLGDEAHLAEQDHEVQMARAELYKLAKYAIKLHEMLKGISERDGLEGWVQSKITKSADMIGSVYHHLEYQESPMGEVTEEVDAPKMNVTDIDKKNNTPAYQKMKKGNPRYVDKTTKKVKEGKDKTCSDKCCGSEVKAEDCKCPPTCEHCNCNAVAESYKESLAAKLENVQQQRKDEARSSASDQAAAAGAYNGGKSIPKQNKKSKPVKRSQADKDAGVAKMDAEDKAARKAQADKFAAIKKSADNKGK
jgi:hypothetical protein